jgi:hypothetical protein
VNEYQLAVAHATKIALLMALVGLFVRRRASACWSFTIYLAVVLTCNCLVSFWPRTFWVYDFWIRKQAAYDILKLAIAVELGARAFRSFPGALAAARIVGLVVLSASGLLIAATAGGFHPHRPWDWLTATSTATIWVFAAVAMLVLWFRIPVSSIHRAILLGFVPYLAVFTVLTGLLQRHGMSVYSWITVSETYVYLFLVSWWAVSSWHREEPVAVDAAVAARLGLAT